MNITQLKKQYELTCSEYVEKFSRKQGIKFNYWVSDNIGGIACFIDQYFFSFNDIRIDMEAKQPKGLIIEWNDAIIDYHSKNNKQASYINYGSYIKGFRFENLK
jgi:hypothetical protein